MRVGLRRGALLVGLAGAAAAGCGDGVDQPDVVSVGDVYGIPPDASPDRTVPTDIAVYGIPPGDVPFAPDADVVSAADAYGIPPDASLDGSVPSDAAVYGIPPDGR